MRDHYVTVCAACLTASCWHGESLCQKSKEAGTVVRQASELRELALEVPEHFSVAKIVEVTGERPQEARRTEKKAVIPHPEIPGAMLVPLTQGHFAIIDAADAEAVGRHNWVLLAEDEHHHTAYARTTIARKNVSLHIFLWERWGKRRVKQLDHQNRNGLDCRRDNLRPATRGQNVANTPSRSASGFKGVVWHKRDERWQASIMVDGKNKHLGLFTDPIEAARAYNAAAFEAFREFAFLNDIPSNEQVGGNIEGFAHDEVSARAGGGCA